MRLIDEAQPTVGGDLISRKDALAYPLSWEHYDQKNGNRHFIAGVESYRGYIEYLPTMSAEPKRGRWIENAETYYTAINEKGGGVDENTPYFTDDIACPECLAKFSVIDNETERFDYCPNCGARMSE